MEDIEVRSALYVRRGFSPNLVNFLKSILPELDSHLSNVRSRDNIPDLIRRVTLVNKNNISTAKVRWRAQARLTANTKREPRFMRFCSSIFFVHSVIGSSNSEPARYQLELKLIPT